VEAKMLTAAGRRGLAAVRWSTAAFALAILVSACDRGPVEPSPNVVPGEYIVMFKDHVQVQDVPALAHRLAERHGGSVERTWTLAIKGFAVRLREPARIAVIRLRAHPDVASVEPNYVRSYDAAAR
jgi:peptidase inhibitor I9